MSDNKYVLTNGSYLLAAGTTSASASDENISTNGFIYINLKNDDATNSITFAIDEDSTQAKNPIVVKAGESFADHLRGEVLHYSATTGSPSFRYMIR